MHALMERCPANKMYFWLTYRPDITTLNLMLSVDIRCTQKLQPRAFLSINIQHNMWNT